MLFLWSVLWWLQVEGVLYVAVVREKEAAWREYKQALQKDRTAGHVDVEARHSNIFRVSVNTAGRTSVRFYLVYEELLVRTAGRYSYTLNIRYCSTPDQHCTVPQPAPPPGGLQRHRQHSGDKQARHPHRPQVPYILYSTSVSVMW